MTHQHAATPEGLICSCGCDRPRGWGGNVIAPTCGRCGHQRYDTTLSRRIYAFDSQLKRFGYAEWQREHPSLRVPEHALVFERRWDQTIAERHVIYA